MDYQPIRANGWKLPAPDPELEEDQEGQPVVVDVVYNIHEERNGKTIALKVSLQLPLHTPRCPHCEAAGQFPNRSRTHYMTEA